MLKKMMLLALSVGALVALAIPSIAGAQELQEGETPLVAPAKVTATSSNTKTKTAGGTLECGNITIHATVTANGPETSSLEAPTGSVTTSSCFLNQTALGGGHVPVTITPGKTSANVHLEDVEGAPHGTATLTFTTDIGPNECALKSTPTPATVTYLEGSDSIHFAGNLEADPLKAGCPPTGEIEGDFTLETEGGTEVTVS